MTWYLLRHAEKEFGEYYNAELRHQDEPLTATGRRQAAQWAAYLANHSIAAIYVSRYQRTAQTAADLAARLGLALQVDERLNEVDNGVVETMTEQEFQQAYPEVWEAYVRREADFRFPGGETGEEALRRVVDFAEEKLRQHAGENVLIVSHDGLIRVWMCYLLGLPVIRRWDFKTDFAGLTEFAPQPQAGRWRLRRFNQALTDERAPNG